jgi:two-component system, NarL family, nitrate/nitrite response regulator NarL
VSSTPLVVTHPCALVRDALHGILSKSQFRPLHILPAADVVAENYPGEGGFSVWLIGVRECSSTTNDLVRRVVGANPSVRPVILAASHTPKDVLLALEAGAVGFLNQNIPSKQLVKSLELVALGQTVIHHQSHPTAVAQPAAQSDPMRPPAAPLALHANKTSGKSNEGAADEVVRRLSRRELAILRNLTDGASNKMIALKLVITESTVKVHMKSILRKLRLQNRTQAAIWARAHLGELTSSCVAETSDAAL